MKRDDLTRSLSSRPVVYWIVFVVTVAATWFGCFFFAALLTVPITTEKDKDGRLVSKGEFAPYAVGIAVGSIMAGVAAWRLRRRYSGRRLPGDEAPFSTSIGAPGGHETGVQTRSGSDGPASDQIKR